MGEKEFIVVQASAIRWEDFIIELEDVLNNAPSGYEVFSYDFESGGHMQQRAIVIYKKK